MIVKAIICIMRIANEKGVKIHIWVSTPNAASGRETCDKKLSDTLIEHASQICRFARVCGGHYIGMAGEICCLAGPTS